MNAVEKLKHRLATIPLARRLLGALYVRIQGTRFRSSNAYWIDRYARGGSSGPGSYGRLAAFKADILNDFVQEHAIRSVIEFGCGDGHQLSLADYPGYLGLDISPDAVALCRRRFQADSTKRFLLTTDYDGQKAELALSLDVIFHLVEDDVFAAYMADLFAAATRYVIVYATNSDAQAPLQLPHVRHRQFTAWVEAQAPGWQLAAHIPNRYADEGDLRLGSRAGFYIYRRARPGQASSG